MRWSWVTLLAWVGLHSCSCNSSGPSADLILRGGRIYTVNREQPWAEAVAIRGDRFVAVGNSQDLDQMLDDDTVVIELDRRLVLPGIIDSHIHFLEGSLLLDRVQLDEATSLEEMKDIVRLFAEANPEASWIVGHGWYYSYVDGGRLPTRQDLDEVVADRPVFLVAYDGHTAWVNSKALAVAGLDRQSKPLGPGEIVRDAETGEPSGALKEEGAIALVRRVIPRPAREELLDGLRKGIAYAHRFGVTSIHTAGGIPAETEADGYLEGDALDLFAELEQRGELTLRVYSAMSVDETTNDKDLDRFAELAARHRGPWLKAGAVKILMDGVIETHTAAMLEPFANSPETRGTPNYTQAEINELVSDLDERGFQTFTHAIGDRAVRMTLNAYEKAAGRQPESRRRHRIEHVEVVSRSDIPRFADLGVIAAMQPHHGTPDIEGVWAKGVGPERMERAFAWRSLRDAGARLVHGSDWAVVTIDPLVGLHTAVTRQDLDNRPEGGWIPDQRLTLEQAISGYTLDAAFASFEEDIKGSIEVGKLADLAVLSQDLFKVPPRKIAETEVMMTVVGGQVVYASPRFLPKERLETLSPTSSLGEY